MFSFARKDREPAPTAPAVSVAAPAPPLAPPEPKPEPAPVTYLDQVRAAPKKGKRRKPNPIELVRDFVRIMQEIPQVDEILHLTDDLWQGVQELCEKANLQPCSMPAFFAELKLHKDVTPSRPWKIDPERNEEHRYVMDRMVKRGKVVDRPVVYRFSVKDEDRDVQPSTLWNSRGVTTAEGGRHGKTKGQPQKAKEPENQRVA